MGKAKILVGAVSLSILTAVGVVSNIKGDQLEYSPRKETKYSQSIGEALEYAQSLKRDVRTGVVRSEDQIRGAAQAREIPAKKSSGLNWASKGPVNVGGRTRTVFIDPDDNNLVYTGSVTGGLYKSNNKGNNWELVTTFQENLSIASINKMKDGRLLVGTSHLREFPKGKKGGGSKGSYGKQGVYISNAAVSKSEFAYFTQIPGTEKLNHINKIEVDPTGKVWIASVNDFNHETNTREFGLKNYDGSTLTDVASGLPNDGRNYVGVEEFEISKDGQLIVVGLMNQFEAKIETFISTDGGATFTESDLLEGLKTPDETLKIGRVDYAISDIVNPETGKYSVFAVFTFNQGAKNYRGKLAGVLYSNKSGENNSWISIATYSTDKFRPFHSGGELFGGQGYHDMLLTAVPNTNDEIILGGIDLHRWKRLNRSSSAGEWTSISKWFGAVSAPDFVHADQHAADWFDNNEFLIANDGGIFKGTRNEGSYTFHPYNNGYVSHQSYDVDIDKFGEVIVSGSQDNGTLSNIASIERGDDDGRFIDLPIGRGDGFECAISELNPNIVFASAYFTYLGRTNLETGDAGGYITEKIGSKFTPSPSFYTVFDLHEDIDDAKSLDSIVFVPTSRTMLPGEVVQVASQTKVNLYGVDPLSDEYSDYMMSTVLEDTLYFKDTVRAIDHSVDSIFICTREIKADSIVFEDINITEEKAKLSEKAYSSKYNFVFNSEKEAFDSLYVYTVKPADDSRGDLNRGLAVEQLLLDSTYFAVHPSTKQKIAIGAKSIAFNFPFDTIQIQDKVQSLAVTAGLYLGNFPSILFTRDALRFNVANPYWSGSFIRVANAEITSIKVSPNGEFVYAGLATGEVYRVKNIKSAYTPEQIIEESESPNYFSEAEKVWDHPQDAPVTGIDFSVSSPGKMVVTFGGYNVTDGHIYIFANAYEEFPTNILVSSIQGTLPDFPVYSAMVDYQNKNKILIGTEFGLYSTENGGSTWSDASGAIGMTPVYSIKQKRKGLSYGVDNPGRIVVGTHGRGVFTSEALLGITDIKFEDFTNESELSIYPNPMINTASVDYTVDFKEDIQLQIFDLNGNLIKTIVKENQLSGTHQLKFDRSQLKSGIYIVNLFDGKSTKSGKLIVE